MKSYLQKLENNEAILLMYLADELPPQDRAEVEQMLASDARLRGELEILRQTQRLAYDAMASLDAITRPPVAPMTAQNRISQMLRLWVERRRRTTNAPVRRQIPWVRSSFAAAAALMLGYYIWAVYHTAEMHGLPPVTLQPHTLTDNEKLAVLYNSFEISNSESSDLVEHVAEVASIAPSEAEDTSSGDVKSDSNSSGAP